MPATSNSRTGPTALAMAAVALMCCAGAPVVAGLLGGVALGSAVGVGAGVLAVVVVLSATARHWRRGRRRPSSLSTERAS